MEVEARAGSIFKDLQAHGSLATRWASTIELLAFAVFPTLRSLGFTEARAGSFLFAFYWKLEIVL